MIAPDLPGDLDSLTPIPSTPRVVEDLQCPNCGSDDCHRETVEAVCQACGTRGLAETFIPACELCGQVFADAKRVRQYRSQLHPHVCLGCADLETMELSEDELNELAEEYWSAKEQNGGEGSYYSSEAMARAGRID